MVSPQNVFRTSTALFFFLLCENEPKTYTTSTGYNHQIRQKRRILSENKFRMYLIPRCFELYLREAGMVTGSNCSSLIGHGHLLPRASRRRSASSYQCLSSCQNQNLDSSPGTLIAAATHCQDQSFGSCGPCDPDC
jgi:hypothetical protein